MNIATLYNEPRVYAYTLPGIPKLDGWVKVGYTDRQTVAERIAQQLKTPLLDYRIEMDEPAYTKDGRFFRDSAIVWYLPNVASCEAMLDLLKGGYHSNFFRGKNGYEINAAFGGYTGVGKAALEAVDDVIHDPLNTLSITLTCGKLTTGATRDVGYG